MLETGIMRKSLQAFWSFCLCVCLAFWLQGCASLHPEDEIAEQPVETLYGDATKALQAEHFTEAAKLFEEVERQHPYSQWATKSQIMAAYALYQDRKYDEAVIALDRFIELHPGSQHIDYAYYLRALSYYDQISDVSRDQKITRQALEALNALILRFPQSVYSRDASLKKDLAMDHLAGKEMEIGRYYLRKHYPSAAINRFQTVVNDYQTTTHVPEALHRLVEAYLSLGLKDEAVRTAVILGHNFPGSRWYQDTYSILDDGQRKELLKNRSWIDKTVDTLLAPG